MTWIVPAKPASSEQSMKHAIFTRAVGMPMDCAAGRKPPVARTQFAEVRAPQQQRHEDRDGDEPQEGHAEHVARSDEGHEGVPRHGARRDHRGKKPPRDHYIIFFFPWPTAPRKSIPSVVMKEGMF